MTKCEHKHKVKNGLGLIFCDDCNLFLNPILDKEKVKE